MREAVLIKTRSAKSTRVNDRMQNFVFCNVIIESENSDIFTMANRTVFYGITTVLNLFK